MRDPIKLWLLRTTARTLALFSWFFISDVRATAQMDSPLLMESLGVRTAMVGAKQILDAASWARTDEAFAEVGVDRAQLVALFGKERKVKNLAFFEGPQSVAERAAVTRLLAAIDNEFSVLDSVSACGVDWLQMVQAYAKSRSLPEAIVHRSTGVQFLLVPAGATVGRFFKDSAEGGAVVDSWLVCLRPFYIAKVELSEAQWSASATTRPSKVMAESRGLDSRPAVGVSRTMVDKYCNDLRLVLPTEFQFRYVRGVVEAIWSPEHLVESSLLGMRLYKSDEGKLPKTSSGGTHRSRSTIPIFGLIGGVRELCQVGFRSSEGDPVLDMYVDPRFVAIAGSQPVFGDAWWVPASTAKYYYRGAIPADLRQNSVGFRLALSL